jgi:hypothetical protein
MPHIPVRTRTTFALAGVTALALPALGGAAASAATGTPAAATTTVAARTTAAATWTRVTPMGTNIIDDIGLARGSDGVLHVLWTTDATPNQGIMDTPISASGTVGSAVTITRFSLATDPDAVVTPTRVAAIWNGIKTSTGSPEGTFEATRPLSGGKWTVSATHVPPLSGAPFTSSSDTAATGSDGQPWVAFDGTDSLAVDHFGRPEVQLGPTNNCCVVEPGLGTDGHTGTTWVTYASIITGQGGVFARQLQASGRPAGPAKLLPGSAVGGNAVTPEQRVGTTGRGGGFSGVYAAYERGYPTATALDVDKLGSNTPIKVATFGATGGQLGGSTLAPTPSGRLWVAWFFGRGTAPALFVRLSNATATAYGPVQKIALPSGTTTIWKVYLNAQATKLDVLMLVTQHGSDATTAYWHTQIPQP